MKIYCALGKQQFKKWSEFCFSKQFQLTILQNVHLVKSLLFLEASKLTGYSLTSGPEGVVTKKMLWYPKNITKKSSLTKKSPTFDLIFYRILHLRIRKKTIQFLRLNIQSKWPKSFTIVVTLWGSTKPHLFCKMPLFKTSWKS